MSVIYLDSSVNVTRTDDTVCFWGSGPGGIWSLGQNDSPPCGWLAMLTTAFYAYGWVKSTGPDPTGTYQPQDGASGYLVVTTCSD